MASHLSARPGGKLPAGPPRTDGTAVSDWFGAGVEVAVVLADGAGLAFDGEGPWWTDRA